MFPYCSRRETDLAGSDFRHICSDVNALFAQNELTGAGRLLLPDKAPTMS